ncbi:hypothetical protein [Burkholderia multivorans]|nr:hypothetical protein [Burkholderia multivorans]
MIDGDARASVHALRFARRPPHARSNSPRRSPRVELAERPTVFVDDHVSKSFQRMKRRSSSLARRAFSGVQIDISSSVMRVKIALHARDENAREKVGKNDLFQDAENSKKSRKALSDGRYNLKHFVTAIVHQFAHNGLNGFNTDAVSCAKCERTRSAASQSVTYRSPSEGHPCWSRFRPPAGSGFIFGLLALTP